MNTLYHRIGLGGTFDRFHIGHQFFLDFAAGLADHLAIGVTTPELTTHKTLSQLIQSYDERYEELENYLTSKKIPHTLFPLTDIYGPTLTHSKVEAIAVTELTAKGGNKINQQRQKLGLAPLPIHVSSLLKDQTGEFVSSSRIRLGLISRQGEVYQQIFEKTVILNETQRKFFHQKQGEIITTPNSQGFLTYLVGDVVLETFLKNRWPFQIGIYDGKNNRSAYESAFLATLALQHKETQAVTNPPGALTSELVKILKEAVSQQLFEQISDPRFVHVTGEEDLAAVALALLAPLDSRIYYGQSGEGMVEMVITEELKEKFWKVLKA